MTEMENSDSFGGGQVPTLASRQSVARWPEGRTPVMFQRWSELLFLHWQVSPEAIQATLPRGLFVDTFDEKAWMGIVPFFMSGVRPRFCPPIPGISEFPELNLRTYVYDAKGRPGVWFYSLDVNQRLAVMVARRFFSLPYVYSRMKAGKTSNGWIDFHSSRPGAAQQAFRYRRAESIGPAKPGTLEHFLVERYLLFAYREKNQRLLLGRIHHEPYALARPETNRCSRDLFNLNGFADPGRDADHAVMAPGVKVTVFGLTGA